MSPQICLGSAHRPCRVARQTGADLAFCKAADKQGQLIREHMHHVQVSHLELHAGKQMVENRPYENLS